MNRKIKFRAWDGNIIHYWDSTDHPATKEITGTPYPKLFYLPMSYLVGDSNDWNWMQYTGLLDKNGVEIYEGDIVSFGYYDIEIPEMNRSIGVVEYDDKHLCYKLGKKINVPFYEGLRDIEVIGNIYQNPELLN